MNLDKPLSIDFNEYTCNANFYDNLMDFGTHILVHVYMPVNSWLYVHVSMATKVKHVHYTWKAMYDLISSVALHKYASHIFMMKNNDEVHVYD